MCSNIYNIEIYYTIQTEQWIINTLIINTWINKKFFENKADYEVDTRRRINASLMLVHRSRRWNYRDLKWIEAQLVYIPHIFGLFSQLVAPSSPVIQFSAHGVQPTCWRIREQMPISGSGTESSQMGIHTPGNPRSAGSPPGACAWFKSAWQGAPGGKLLGAH